jgi:hypothetical protein
MSKKNRGSQVVEGESVVPIATTDYTVDGVSVVGDETDPPVPPGMNPKKNRVSSQDFVLASKDCTSYADLAKATGMAVSSVKVLAFKLRKAGVKLVPYARKHATINVDELNALL